MLELKVFPNSVTLECEKDFNLILISSFFLCRVKTILNTFLALSGIIVPRKYLMLCSSYKNLYVVQV